MGIIIIRPADRNMVPVNHEADIFKSVIIPKGVVPGLLQCAIAEFEAGAVIEPHVHSAMTEVFHVLSGCLCLKTVSEKHDLYVDDTFIIPPGTEHCLEFIERTRLYYFNLETA